MKRFIPSFLFVLCVMASPVYAEAPTSTSVVKTFYGQLVAMMKQGEQLGFAGRAKQLTPALQAAYNMPLMTKFAVGASWATVPEAQQQQLIASFTAFSVANYAKNFTKFDGEKFDVVGEKPASGGGVIVETTLTPKDSEPVKLNYLVRNDEAGKPRIVDVLLDATISELATRRAEFSAIVKRDGVPALQTTLDEKTKKLGE